LHRHINIKKGNNIYCWIHSPNELTTQINMKEHLFEHNDEQDYKSQRDFKKINAVTTIVVKRIF